MSLISNYRSVGSGIVTSFDFGVRDVLDRSTPHVAGTVSPYYELRIIEVREFVGMTEQCAKDFGSTSIRYYADGGTQSFPHHVSRNVSYSTREMSRQPRAYGTTLTTELSVDVYITGLTGPSINIPTGKYTYPLSIMAYTTPNPNLVSAFCYVIGLYSATMQTIQFVTQRPITVTEPSIVLCAGWNAANTPSNAVFYIYS